MNELFIESSPSCSRSALFIYSPLLSVSPFSLFLKCLAFEIGSLRCGHHWGLRLVYGSMQWLLRSALTLWIHRFRLWVLWFVACWIWYDRWVFVSGGVVVVWVVGFWSVIGFVVVGSMVVVVWMVGFVWWVCEWWFCGDCGMGGGFLVRGGFVVELCYRIFFGDNGFIAMGCGDWFCWWWLLWLLLLPRREREREREIDY